MLPGSHEFDQVSTRVSDQWSIILGAFRRKLIEEGFSDVEAFELSMTWFKATLQK